MRLLKSLTFRLALTYAALFTASVALLLGLLYVIAIAVPLQRSKGMVDREAEAFAHIFIVDGAAVLKQRLEARAARVEAQMAFHVFVAPDGTVVSSNLPSWPRRFSPEWQRVEADIYSDGDEEDHEALIRDRLFADGARLIVGRDIEVIDDREEMLRAIARWVAGSTLLLGVFGALLMSLAIGRRIETFSRAARGVIAGDLSERVPVRGTGDDFDQLAETLNLMLSRIEELVSSVRRVSDNVAHELRTPLARLHSELEELAEQEKQPAQREQAERALAEAVRLRSIFDALLRIARIESGRHAAQMRPIELGPLIVDAADYYAPAAEARSITLTTDVRGQPKAPGDADLLFQAVSNLLDNAIKFTPENGRISLSAAMEGDAAVIWVADTGAGIPQAELSRITERFHRVPGHENVVGTGLGLSLVQAIAQAHRAELRFSSGAGGFMAELRLPSSA